MNTLLLPLRPAGEGTAQVEAFASYYARLARIHMCGLAQLARFLSSYQSARAGRTVALCNSVLYAFHGAGLFGYRERVEEYVELVEMATGSTFLRRCTLVPMRPLLPENCIYTMRTQRAWCEQCFREDEQTDSGPYDRLLWTLKAVQRCPEHRIALRTTCPSCGAIQRNYHFTGDPQICNRCQCSLVGPNSELCVRLQPSFGERDLCEIVSAISEGRFDAVNPDAIEEFQRALRNIVSPVSTIVEGIAKISGHAIAARAHCKLSLQSMLRKAHAAGVSLVNIVEDPTLAAHVAGQLVFDRNMIAATARVRHPKALLLEIKGALKQQLAFPKTVQIPELVEVAERCGVSEGYIRHHCANLVKRYQSHRISATAYHRQAAERRCVQLISSKKYLEETRHLHSHLKKFAAQLAIDAQSGVNVARVVVRRYRGEPEKYF